jgi:hypothetical protein
MDINKLVIMTIIGGHPKIIFCANVFIDTHGELRLTSYWSKESKDFRAKIQYEPPTRNFRITLVNLVLKEAVKPTVYTKGVDTCLGEEYIKQFLVYRSAHSALVIHVYLTTDVT